MVEMGEYRDGAFIRLVRDPRLFSEDDKRYARDAGCEYVCRCSPGRDLRYRFSKDLRLYPVHPNVIASKHAKTCPFSDRYEKALANRPAFEVDAETGRTAAFISENIERPVTDSAPLPPRKRAFTDSDGVKRQPLGMAELMRTVSMELSVRQAESFNPKNRTIYEMNRWIYMYSKEIELERLSCRLNDSGNENIRFFCERLSGLSFLTKDSYGVSEKELSTFNYNLVSFTNTFRYMGYRAKITTLRGDGKGGVDRLEHWVTDKAFGCALAEFMKEHTITKNSPLFDPENEYVTVVGYEYKLPYTGKDGSERMSWKIGRLWLFLTCSHGIACRDEAEAMAHDVAFDVISQSEGARFSKPPEMADSDGVITLKGCPVRVVLTVHRDNKKKLLNYKDSVVVHWMPGRPEWEDSIVLKERIRFAMRRALGDARKKKGFRK